MKSYTRRNKAFLYISLCLFTGLSACSKQTSTSQQPVSAGQSKLLSESTAGHGINSKASVLGNVNQLLTLPKDGQNHYPQNLIVISDEGYGAAYIAEQEGKQRVVHNGKPGKEFSEISRLTISPDGKRVSYRCTLLGKQQAVVDGVPGNVYDNVRDFYYSPDSRHLAHVVQLGNMITILLDGKSIEESAAFGDVLFSANSSQLIYTIRPEGGGHTSLVIYDLKSGTKSVTECLDVPMAMNSDTSRLAVAVRDGDKQRVVDFDILSPKNNIRTSEGYKSVSDIAISSDGKAVAFVGVRDKKRYLVLNGKEELLPDGTAVNAPPTIRPDLKGAGIILSHMDAKVKITAVYWSPERKLKLKAYEQIQELVYNSEGTAFAYVAKKKDKWFIVVNEVEGPEFDMVVTPKFSPDGSKLIYRARTKEKRLVVVADIAKKEHHRNQEYEMVFPISFTADGKSIVYGVKDADKLLWKVETL